ncbi:hypothetical protein SAY86_010530 [Trapa natans]|uniref:BHLH domain-containing protein n=1 Tax=Trapa natans TaxID=22666 RepID=A0AAN7LV66_TRANT|nr:hypothetical protein SAY86_010530 [Trapa natans]
MMGDHSGCSFGDHQEFVDMTGFSGPASPDDLFGIFECLDAELAQLDAGHQLQAHPVLGLEGAQRSSSRANESETENETAAAAPASSPRSKRPRAQVESSDMEKEDGTQRISHITVERNRRKQMNEHLSVLRSLMPCFYVKRGDQASIIEGVVDYINELQQILQSLEAKRQRKVYSETVLSPRPVMSPRPSPLSPRSTKPPLSPRLNLPVSPRTPQPTSPYRPPLTTLIHRQTRSGGNYSCSALSSPSPTTSSSGSSMMENLNELAAKSMSSMADVEVRFSGANLLLKTVSFRIPGQITKIISVLEDLSLEILQVNINPADEVTMVNSFTIKIGIECQLSADDLVHHIQQSFH